MLRANGEEGEGARFVNDEGDKSCLGVVAWAHVDEYSRDPLLSIAINWRCPEQTQNGEEGAATKKVTRLKAA